MKVIKYILSGFGFESVRDFQRACCGLYTWDKIEWKVLVVALGGAVRVFLKDYTGFDLPVFFAFVFLIVAEFWTGVKVARQIRGEKFKSRKAGRMILKIGTYVVIVAVLHLFAKNIDAPDLMGVSLNPFVWLYYTVFIAIVFQLMISWLENLGALGYKETRTIAGFVLRKFNKWFEFDGSKNNNQE